jgi:uncharacterized lipoprotein YbaY
MSNLLPVTGEILFDKDIGSFFGATAYVRLQDVSMSDAPSKAISEQILKNVGYDPNDPKPVAFSLYPENYDPTGRYIVSIHVDVNGNGVLDAGDLINMESYPVLTHGYPTKVTVKVKQIR